MQTIVIGHKNPDMDSICSALGYAHLKRALGYGEVIAGRAGSTNERIDFVLDRFAVEAPAFFSDVSPRVADVMHRDVISVRSGSTLYDAVQIVDRNRIRGLPVVDGDGRLLGLLSANKISHHLFPSRENSGKARIVNASLADMVATFGGKVLCGTASAEVREFTLVIAAMDSDMVEEKMGHFDPASVVLFVNARPDVQESAIRMGVRALIITDGSTLLPHIEELAKSTGTVVADSPHDTATTVLLARGATSVDGMLDTEYTAFTPETSLEAAREKAATVSAFIFPVLDEDGKLAGIFSKSDFLKPVQRQLILVDHNELGQAVRGADRIDIVEIVDHHRLGGFSTDTPILFWNQPVGSTSTLVALAFRQHDVPIPLPIAGLLMAGLISDTLNLTSPTATGTDREILAHLENITGVRPGDLAEQIFSVGSPLLTLKPEEAVQLDCKEYNEGGARFTVAQIEELGFSHYDEKEEALIAALEAHGRASKLLFAALLVTDVNTQNSRLIAVGDERLVEKIDYPQRRANVWEMQGIVSRKKQLLPYLLQCLP